MVIASASPWPSLIQQGAVIRVLHPALQAMGRMFAMYALELTFAANLNARKPEVLPEGPRGLPGLTGCVGTCQ